MAWKNAKDPGKSCFAVRKEWVNVVNCLMLFGVSRLNSNQDLMIEWLECWHPSGSKWKSQFRKLFFSASLTFDMKDTFSQKFFYLFLILSLLLPERPSSCLDRVLSNFLYCNLNIVVLRLRILILFILWKLHFFTQFIHTNQAKSIFYPSEIVKIALPPLITKN